MWAVLTDSTDLMYPIEQDPVLPILYWQLLTNSFLTNRYMLTSDKVFHTTCPVMCNEKTVIAILNNSRLQP